MKKVALASVAVVALTLLFGTAVGNAQVRESTHTAGLQIEGMRRNDAQHKRDGDRDHLHRHPVVVVAVPVFTRSLRSRTTQNDYGRFNSPLCAGYSFLH